MYNNYHELSVRLYKILDVIGASEDVRTLYWENAMTEEIFDTLHYKDKNSMYRFGSSCEGTTTPGLRSDIDMLNCFTSLTVIEKLENAPEYGHSLLMVSDADTKPGYFKLQLVKNGVPQTIFQREINAESEDTDSHGRICLKHVISKDPVFERNGPADTDHGEVGFKKRDFVNAFRCQDIPSSANSWIHIIRPCDWPSKAQILNMEKYGCFFVGVGHPKSENKVIEWRCSFSLQERDLMASLNPTQHKCYILLKMIKNDLIKPRAGEKSISSYHCKTCLFSVLENSKPGLWNRGSLIQGVRVCLSVLLQWVKSGYCPNFFIPGENMFDRLEYDTLDKLGRVLTELLKSGTRFLFNIQCDSIGFYLAGGSLSLTQIKNELQIIPEHDRHYNTTQKLYLNRNRLLRSAGNIRISLLCLFETLFLLKRISVIDLDIDNSKREVCMVFNSLLPFIHLQIAQTMASFINSGAQIGSLDLKRVFVHSVYISQDCDLISSKLIEATLCFKTDKLDKCEDMLLTCDTYLESFVTSICNCTDNPIYTYTSLLELLKRSKLSSREFRRKCTTGCLLFLPSQAKLIHPALHLEMYRSMYTPPGSRYEDNDFWFDWILVDSRVYLYFLQYLLYSKINNPGGKLNVLETMLHLINTDLNLGHKETACNLLGWILLEENRVHDAVKCFQLS